MSDYLTFLFSEAELLTSEVAAREPAWCRLVDILLAIRELKEDWDGQGAVAPDPAIVDGAIGFAHFLRENGREPAARVIAGVNGTVFFEWHAPDWYTEAEVVAPDRVETRYLQLKPGG